jgi:exonuclease SbcD
MEDRRDDHDRTPGGSMRFCFIHAADLHLDTPFTGIGRVDQRVADTLRDASLKAFDNLIDLALSKNAAFVVLAGDIYDGPERGVRAQLRFRRGLEHLSDAGIWTFVVHGNHDPVATGWSAIRSDWPPLVKIFGPGKVEEFTVEKDGEPIATVRGISFATGAETSNLALRFPERSGPELHIGVLHCNLGGDTEHDPYAPCCVDDLAKPGYDYWALGHIHRRTVVRDGDPWIVYPGNLQGRHPKASEQGAKGAYAIEVDGSTVHPPEFVPLDVVRFLQIELDITDVADLPSLERQLWSKANRSQASLEGRSALVRAVLTGRGPVHSDLGREGTLDELLRVLRDEGGTEEPFLFWESIRDETLTELDLDAIRKRGDFACELLRYADETFKDEASLADFAESHLHAPDHVDAETWTEGTITALETLTGGAS